MTPNITTFYQPFLKEILERIQSARYAMLKSVSKETVLLYWDIGKSVSEKAQNEGWGKSVVEQLSKDLQKEFPGVRGFSARNIWRMKTFYEFYSQNEKLPPLVAEIGWVQNCIILEQCKDLTQIEFYLRKSKQMGWSKLDLTGQIVNHMVKNEDAEDWEVVDFPAIMPSGKPLWPEFWSIEELLAKKASLDVRYWNAQYLQQPTSEEGALIKREWWQIWDKDDPPDCEFVIMSLDAAQEANNRADYNALTTWGVFFNEETSNYNIILLNSIKKRMEFPDLKKLVLEEYKEWEPDSFMVEKKSNGAALYQELRRMGVPIGEFTPGKGQDKISRVNAVSDLFSAGIVWAPEHRWAKEVIEECNDFPSGANDDLVDSTTLALLRFRQGGFIRLPSDEPEDDFLYKYGRRKAAYY
jgi:predicted phage terminase large subunit-like protein